MARTAHLRLVLPKRYIDFGYRAMHEMTVQSKALIQSFYKQGPRLSFYQGCSTGGRQGLSEAQRYPEDFDAIIAGAPVYNQTRLHASQMSLMVEMLKKPESILSNAKKTTVANAVLGACDQQDGVKDDIVNNPQMCKFDPAALLCKAGDADSCLTAAQVETAKKAYAPVKLKTGELVYPPHSFGFEAGWRMPTAGGTPPNLPGDSFRILGHQDPNWNLNSFELDSDLASSPEERGKRHRCNQPRSLKVQGSRRQAASVSRLGGSGSGAGEHDQLRQRGQQTGRAVTTATGCDCSCFQASVTAAAEQVRTRSTISLRSKTGAKREWRPMKSLHRGTGRTFHE